MPVLHKFTSAKSDPADTTLVGASKWNDKHAITDAFTSVSANYAVLTTDEFIKATAGSGAGITLTLPDATANTGVSFKIKRIDAGTANVTIATTSAQTIDGVTTYTLTNQWQFVKVTSDGFNWLIAEQN